MRLLPWNVTQDDTQSAPCEHDNSSASATRRFIVPDSCREATTPPTQVIFVEPRYTLSLSPRRSCLIPAFRDQDGQNPFVRSTIGRAGDAVASAAGAVGQGAFGVAAAVAAALQLRQVCEP